MVIDRKTFADDGMVTAVGVTLDGRKIILGFVQTVTENRCVGAAFLRALVDRGLRADQGLLIVTDGAKGLHAAVDEVFGGAAVLWRCQWHNRENVVSYLPEKHRALATALLDLEPHVRGIKNYQALPLLRKALNNM